MHRVIADVDARAPLPPHLVGDGGACLSDLEIAQMSRVDVAARMRLNSHRAAWPAAYREAGEALGLWEAEDKFDDVAAEVLRAGRMAISIEPFWKSSRT